MKKVLMLLETTFPHDDRVEKEINTLKQHGYDVHLACSTRSMQAKDEVYKNIRVFRIHQSKIWFKLSALVLLFPMYLNRWYRFAERLHSIHKYDIIHIHDLPLSKVGVRMKSNYGLKMVCDQHEYYSNWIVETAHYNTFIGRIVKTLSNWKSYEKKTLSKADLVITVEAPLRTQYINEYGLQPQRVICLPNTPDRNVFHIRNTDPKLFAEYNGKFVILYFGGIDILRGIDNVIRAIPTVVKTIPDFKFVLAGKLYGGYDPLKTARKLHVEKYVDFVGWVDLNGIPSLIDKSNLGIFTPPSDRTEINKTIATKNYQFLVMNKPMIVGKAEYMKNFTEKNGIGISVDENDPKSIAAGILFYAKNAKERKLTEKNCKKIGSDYYWEVTSTAFITGYNNLF